MNKLAHKLLGRWHSGGAMDPSRRDAIVQQVTKRLFTSSADYERLQRSNGQFADSGLADYLFATPDCQHLPEQTFPRLRWGGQFVFVTQHARQAEQLFEQYRRCEDFNIDAAPQAIDSPASGFRLMPFRRRTWFFAARKVMLTRPGEMTERYSYDVRLAPTIFGNGSAEASGAGTVGGEYVVVKQVPTMEHARQRLALRFPDADPKIIENGARKLVQKVFPLFLTREAAILKILQRDLPDSYKPRVPTVLGLEKDEQGFVQKLYLNWLRLGSRVMSQFEFARQSAELLHVLHEKVDVIHLDLRLDNFVITEHGVGFVDFGSSVRVGENLAKSPMLTSLFSEMLSTSQIHIDLRRLCERGKVTSSLFVNSYRKIDKAVDLFYLVLQMNQPHMNPDFKGLVRFDPRGVEAAKLSQFSRDVMQPGDPQHPAYRTAWDVLQGLDRAERGLHAGADAPSPRDVLAHAHN